MYIGITSFPTEDNIYTLSKDDLEAHSFFFLNKCSIFQSADNINKSHYVLELLPSTRHYAKDFSFII